MLDIAAASESISQSQAWELWFQNVDISNKTLVLGMTVRGWGRVGKCLQAFAALTVLLDIVGAPAVRRFGRWLTGLTTLSQAKYLTVAGLKLFADIFANGLPDVMFRLGNIARHARKLVASVMTFCRPGTGREKRLDITRRAYRRTLPAIFMSKKGLRRKTRWRARVFSQSVRFQRFEKRFILPVIYVIAGVLAVFLFYDNYSQGFPEGFFSTLFLTLFAFYLFTMALVVTLLAIRMILSALLLLTAILAFVFDAVLVEPAAWVIGHPKNENLIKGVSIVIFLVGFYFDLLAS